MSRIVEISADYFEARARGKLARLFIEGQLIRECSSSRHCDRDADRN
jgi:hypothetical protein